MSDDLLHPRWEKRPRTNYVAIASNNIMALRSSHADKYAYASICINNENDTQFTYWASFHSTKELADRQTKWATKQYKERGYIFETIQLQKLDTKEYNKLSKARLKETNAKREAWRVLQQAQYEQLVSENLNQETELQNV